jgi:hypothetical protein
MTLTTTKFTPKVTNMSTTIFIALNHCDSNLISVEYCNSPIDVLYLRLTMCFRKPWEIAGTLATKHTFSILFPLDCNEV